MASSHYRPAIESIAPLFNDWLIRAGDLTDGPRLFDWCRRILTKKFRRDVWVPGNNELSNKLGSPSDSRGATVRDGLAGIFLDPGVIPPGDPYRAFANCAG